MSKVKELLSKIITKATGYLDKPSQVENGALFEAFNEVFLYEMPFGTKFTQEEIIKNNIRIISNLDAKFYFILKILDELNGLENNTSLDTFVKEPYMMKMWLAHNAHTNSIESFHSILRQSKHKPNPKMPKCITDLPLQEKLLN